MRLRIDIKCVEWDVKHYYTILHLFRTFVCDVTHKLICICFAIVWFVGRCAIEEPYF